MLISCFINMLNNSFDFKSFIINVILNNLKKIFQFFALINTDVIDMTFIKKFLISELCKYFDIQSILLSKLKLIQLYDEILNQKSITYILYILITIQEYKNEIMFLLITYLKQHKIIINNF